MLIDARLPHHGDDATAADRDARISTSAESLHQGRHHVF